VSRAELAREAVDVSWLCLQILDDLRRTDPSRAVIVDVAPDLVAHADPRLLRVVLENLLGNAWKFSFRRDPAHLGVHGTKDGVRTTYTISDDGAGFDMAYAHRLFNAFQRLHAPTEFEGTGIGLATVYRIVTRHGGRVWAESAPDRGARFSFTLE
jgi:light-regulated signal transduction histidine kinase (bacteriophytochrome)